MDEDLALFHLFDDEKTVDLDLAAPTRSSASPAPPSPKQEPTHEPSDSSQQSLADYVKGVHAHLRKKVRDGKCAEDVWQDHLRHEKEMRRRYADSMHSLATRHWANVFDARKRSRIEWTKNRVLSYFFGRTGNLDRSGLYHYVGKDVKRKLFCDKNWAEYRKAEEGSEAFHSEVTARWQACVGSTSTKLSLLDVGSCYDPFGRFPDFCTVAIDISPASDQVLEVDFLEAPVAEAGEPNSVLVADHFHVVVFSLLLEYFPSPRQRWVCCLKANRVLRRDGILVIVTPDSSHPGKRTKQMQSWKQAMETHLGFLRISYEKLKHLHCMAFRKVETVSAAVDDFEPFFEELYIPQDRNNSTIDPVSWRLSDTSSE